MRAERAFLRDSAPHDRIAIIMLPSLVSRYVCPACKGDLTAHAFVVAGDEIERGILLCNRCHAAWIIDRGLPRFVPCEYYQRSAEFLREYGDRIAGAGGRPAMSGTLEGLAAHLQKTEDLFGYEWNVWKDLGFTNTQGRTKEREPITFWAKSFLTREMIVGKTVLDAGCGNGRYARVAGEFGADLFAFDLGTLSTEATAENCKDLPNVHVFQGDIFKTPFRPETFDFVYSISVLMHTGDARGAFASLVPLVKRGGTISVHVYHKGNALYERVDAAIRRRTLRYDKEKLMRFSKRAAFFCSFLPYKLQIAANLLLRIEPWPMYVFDWYGAPTATHHTYPEVFEWVKENGLDLIDHANRPHRFWWWKKYIKPPFFLTVRGRKP